MKTTYHHGNLKQALIESGLKILAEAGAEALSLRKVAREAGVSEAAPYRHFKDKEALLAGIAEAGFRQLAAVLEKVEKTYADDASTLFYQSSLAYIDFARGHPDKMRVMYRKRKRDEATTFPALQEAADDAFSFLIDMVEYCQQEGLARAGHPMPLAMSIWSTVHGLAILLIDGSVSPDVFQGMDEDTLIRNTLATILHGWR